MMKGMFLLVGFFCLPASAIELDFTYSENEHEFQVTCSVNGDYFSGVTYEIKDPHFNEYIDKGVSFSLPTLLSNNDEGKHTIVCAGLASDDNRQYNISFDVIKYKRNDSSEYKWFAHGDDGYAYGVRLTHKSSDCLKPAGKSYDKTCLRRFYGDGKYFLYGVEGAQPYRSLYPGYSNIVGVTLAINPYYQKE